MSKPVITDLHFHVLAWLRDRPGGSIEDAAAALHLELAVAERLFRDLQRVGYVESTDE